MQEITITKVRRKGDGRINYNIDLNGAPWGQIWTYKAKGEVHPFHVQPGVRGVYRAFKTYKLAEAYARGEM